MRPASAACCSAGREPRTEPNGPALCRHGGGSLQDPPCAAPRTWARRLFFLHSARAPPCSRPAPASLGWPDGGAGVERKQSTENRALGHEGLLSGRQRKSVRALPSERGKNKGPGRCGRSRSITIRYRSFGPIKCKGAPVGAPPEIGRYRLSFVVVIPVEPAVPISGIILPRWLVPSTALSRTAI